MNNYKFINHKDCEFFPCHKTNKPEEFNCGGNFKYTPHGIKDCSNCNLPHVKEVGYDHIQKKMLEVIEIVQQEYLDKRNKENK